MKANQPNPCARGEDHSYNEHARSMSAAARTAHAEWVAKMTPDERKALRDLHLESPPDDDNEVGGHSPYSLSDIADTPLARTDIDFAAEIDKPHQIIADTFGLTEDQAHRILCWHQTETETALRSHQANFLQLIVGGLLSSKNPKLNAAGLAFAAGLAALNGLPCQREYARQNHVSPSAISKVVIAWQRALNLRPSAHQKSVEACKTYSEVGKTRHWRARPFKADMATTLLKRLRPSSNDPSLN